MFASLALFKAPFVHITLFRQFLRREVLGRYRGSLLGLGWAFVLPLAMLAVYTFVFSGVFQARWPGAEASGGVAFALRLFAGLMVFQLFADVVSRSPSLITSQPNLVKKVVFPLELLPFVSLGSALFHFAASMSLLLGALLLIEQRLPVTALLAPLAVLPLLPLLLGLSLLLSALGVFVRDIATVVGVGVSMMLFLSPVFYSIDSLAPRWQFWMRLNPITPAIEDLRRTLFLGLAPVWTHWWLALCVGLVTAAGGAWVFSKTRTGFADVL